MSRERSPKGGAKSPIIAHAASITNEEGVMKSASDTLGLDRCTR